MNNTKKINLLITVFDLHFGGISNLILQTTPALTKEMNIGVVYFGPKDEMLESYLNRGIKVTRIKYNGITDLLGASIKLSKFIRRERIDIVSTHLFLDKIISWLARLFVNFKLVSTLHSANNPYEETDVSSKFKLKLEDYFHNHIVDKNIAVSDASLKAWKRWRNFRHPNTVVIHSGIEGLGCFKNDLNNNHNKTIFVTACRFTQEKGLDRLIKYFKKLSEKSPHWELWLIGDGFLRSELENLVIRENLSDKIIFKGFHRELCKFYKDADFYINSSYHEAFPVSILEALSVGLPVIGSNVGGIPEVILDNENGFLTNFDDDNHTLRILNYCLEIPPEKYRVMSKNSYEIFRTKFSLKSYRQKTFQALINI